MDKDRVLGRRALDMLLVDAEKIILQSVRARLAAFLMFVEVCINDFGDIVGEWQGRGGGEERRQGFGEVLE